MGKAFVTLKIMPEDVEVDLKALENEVTEIIRSCNGSVGKVETEPIAFGLNALKIIFLIDEGGNTEVIEEKCKKLSKISSAEII
ncbi:MAG: elongation factor 1-beta, partial [Nanoarchaeota archaeon]